MKQIFCCSLLRFIILLFAWIIHGVVADAAADLEAIMRKLGVIPDVIDVAPKAVLEVAYGSTTLNVGDLLTPTQVKDHPTVLRWNADPKKFYLLYLTDPDTPSRAAPILREWHHYLVGNIPGKNVSKGDVLTQYVGSGPPKGTGVHRYVWLVYEQPNGKLTFDEPRIANTSVDNRGGFSIRKLAKKYKLGKPVAGTFYQAEWDEYVPKLHEQLGLTLNKIVERIFNSFKGTIVKLEPK